MRPLRVAIDARIASGVAGGVEQVVIGLANGLSKLSDGDEEYLFLTNPGDDDWIRPYLHGPCQLLPSPSPYRKPKWARSAYSSMPLMRALWSQVSPLIGPRSIHLQHSDGTIERAGIDLMHFPFQQAFLTHIPSIYQPHDLQHIHLPGYFSPRDRLAREVSYRAFCDQAETVAVMSSWGKQDLLRQYGLPDQKVVVIPGAPVLSAYATPSADDVASTRRRFRLPDAFAFYPAQTWAHKNHLCLLEALAALRDRYGLKVPLVCSGRMNEFFPKIERRIHELNMADQVSFLGFISPLDVQCLYASCRCVIFPTLFEGFGMPLFEAFLAGAPVACSNITSLPEYAGDAALIFDPGRPDEIAAAILRLWTDETIRVDLVERGKRQVAPYTWERTARMFRAHYRRIAGRALTDEDEELIAAPGSAVNYQQ